jgi:cyclase
MIAAQPGGHPLRQLTFTVLAASVAAHVAAQPPDLSKMEVQTVKVAGSVSMLMGGGGNVGVSMGPDGAFLVDDQYAPMSPKIQAAVKALGPQPLRFVLNTHWHGDHTGSNEQMGEAGALIVAHENVRVRMSSEQFLSFFNERTPPSPARALPVVTFTDAVTFHINGDEVRAFHVPPAHTDGDAIVHFKKADVIHMGDTFFNGMYPFIDLDSGGNVAGMIATADLVLKMAGPQTKIIPGHGPLASVTDLKAFRDMLKGARDRITSLVKDGKTLDQVVAEKPLATWDPTWGHGFIKSDAFVGLVFADVSKAGKAKK